MHDVPAQLLRFISGHQIETLNVAGTRYAARLSAFENAGSSLRQSDLRLILEVAETFAQRAFDTVPLDGIADLFGYDQSQANGANGAN